MRKLEPNGDLQVRVDGRTKGTLLIERSSDFSSWEEVLRQPLAEGLQDVIVVPAPQTAGNGFFRATVF